MTFDFWAILVDWRLIAKGISSGQVLGGMSWGFGDDAVWTFKKVGETAGGRNHVRVQYAGIILEYAAGERERTVRIALPQHACEELGAVTWQMS